MERSGRLHLSPLGMVLCLRPSVSKIEFGQTLSNHIDDKSQEIHPFPSKFRSTLCKKVSVYAFESVGIRDNILSLVRMDL